MIKAYIRHLSDVSNMMAEMLIQNHNASPRSLPLAFNLENTAALMPGNFALAHSVPGVGSGGVGHGGAVPKHRNYKRKMGTSRKKTAGSSSSQTLPVVTSSSANSADEYDNELPGQASLSRTEMADPEYTRRTTSVV